MPTPASLSQVRAITLLLLLICAGEANAQDIRVALTVYETDGGRFYSNFASALRSLGDVSVLTESEEHDVHVRVIVACENDACASASSYAVSIHVTRPVQPPRLAGGLSAALGLPFSWDIYQRIEREIIADAARRLSAYRSHELGLVAYWGRNVYERAIRELIADIDSQCFETLRLGARLITEAESGNVQSAISLNTRLADQNGVCS